MCLLRRTRRVARSRMSVRGGGRRLCSRVSTLKVGDSSEVGGLGGFLTSEGV